MKERPVIVTTEWRGVFYGLATGQPDDQRRISLRECRNVIYWSADVNGFGGLATGGPTDGCRIGPAIPKIKLFGVTSLLECSEAAVKQWAKQK